MFNFIPNAWNIAAKLITDLKASGEVVLSSLIGAPNGVAGAGLSVKTKAEYQEIVRANQPEMP